jgi:hypothetical protein
VNRENFAEEVAMTHQGNVSRRGFARRALGAVTAILAMGTASAPQPAGAQAKAPKSAVNYQAKPKVVGGTTQKCANCQFYIPPTETETELGKCTLVKGEVAADAWCNIWAPAGS